MQQARDRLADAQAIIGTAHPAVVVSAAYYGMLYAARAALSTTRRHRRASTKLPISSKAPPNSSPRSNNSLRTERWQTTSANAPSIAAVAACFVSHTS
jgi:hypothetical protein